MNKTPDIQTVAFVSLGCPKNLVDSEKMLGLLAMDGLIPVSDVDDADAIVINTCGFLAAAKDESLGVIGEALEHKRTGRCRRVVVVGCLVQRHRAKLLQWRPGIDALVGVFDRDRISDAVRGAPESGGQDAAVARPVYSSIAASAALARKARGIEATGYHESDTARLRLTPRHYAYLRLSEGCNQNCAFCTIPSIRGKMRSKPVAAICAEAAELIRDGAFELNLIGQDTTSYGEDLGDAPGLAGLLGELDRAFAASGGAASGGGGWLRLMYAYPSTFTDEMIGAMASLPNVLPYIDIPLQHINDRVLTAMRRHTSRRQIEKLLTKLRDTIAGVAIRTTFITGFPGETDAEHEELLDFVRGFGFANLGVFDYSPEPGTPAARRHAAGEAIPDEVIAQRRDELMLAQQEIVFARNAELAAQRTEVDVLIDGEADSSLRAPHAAFACAGRTFAQAPQIDANTIVHCRDKLAPGERVRCALTAWRDYDLIAQPVTELSKGPSE